MIIKKFEAETEKKAILLAKDELGKNAIVVNIKTIKPRGIQRLFRKASVEVMAAADEKTNQSKEKFVKETENHINYKTPPSNTDFFPKEDNVIEEKLNSLQNLLVKQLNEEMEEKEDTRNHTKLQKTFDKNDDCLEMISNSLVDNEVDEKYVNQIIDETRGALRRETSVDNILTSVYQKIVLKMGEPVLIDLQNTPKKFIFFIGPTGVGKTTTIAKIASYLKLKDRAKIALITADTYRIAAVEQLRTYAGILGVPLSVVYTADELEMEKEKYADYDIVLIDTAGRSHKNVEQKKDLEELVNTIPESEREIFLVLSATTKYKDLIKITENYQIFNDYSIIFTKLDETMCVGNILNIRMFTNAPLSYMTWGQNVPDDFGSMNVQDIAKKLLGGSQ